MSIPTTNSTPPPTTIPNTAIPDITIPNTAIPNIATAPSIKPSDRLLQLLPNLFNPQQRTGESFLRLQITPELTVAIALDWVEETRLVMATDLTPIPNMPPHVLGLISTKGQVFWLLSLAQLFGLPPAQENLQRYEVAIIRAFVGADQPEELFLGLAVQQIKGSIRLGVKEFVPIDDTVAPAIAPFLIGYAAKAEESLLILNPEILSKPPR
jgi:positive phototaxis protein PixI